MLTSHHVPLSNVALTSNANGWSDWIQQRITQDGTGRYYPFVISNAHFPTTPTSDAAFVRRREFAKICESVSASLNPSFSQTNMRRKGPNQCVGVIALPAAKGDSTHFHGWIRVPTTDTTVRVVSIKQNTQTMQIAAPSTLHLFRDQCERRLKTTNVWFANNGRSALTDADQDFAAFDYLTKHWKQEVRHWEALESIPAYLFKQLQRVGVP